MGARPSDRFGVSKPTNLEYSAKAGKRATSKRRERRAPLPTTGDAPTCRSRQRSALPANPRHGMVAPCARYPNAARIAPYFATNQPAKRTCEYWQTENWFEAFLATYPLLQLLTAV